MHENNVVDVDSLQAEDVWEWIQDVISTVHDMNCLNVVEGGSRCVTILPSDYEIYKYVMIMILMKSVHLVVLSVVTLWLILKLLDVNCAINVVVEKFVNIFHMECCTRTFTQSA